MSKHETMRASVRQSAEARSPSSMLSEILDELSNLNTELASLNARMTKLERATPQPNVLSQIEQELTRLNAKTNPPESSPEVVSQIASRLSELNARVDALQKPFLRHLDNLETQIPTATLAKVLQHWAQTNKERTKAVNALMDDIERQGYAPKRKVQLDATEYVEALRGVRDRVDAHIKIAKAHQAESQKTLATVRAMVVSMYRFQNLLLGLVVLAMAGAAVYLLLF